LTDRLVAFLRAYCEIPDVCTEAQKVAHSQITQKYAKIADNVHFTHDNVISDLHSSAQFDMHVQSCEISYWLGSEA